MPPNAQVCDFLRSLRQNDAVCVYTTRAGRLRFARRRRARGAALGGGIDGWPSGRAAGREDPGECLALGPMPTGMTGVTIAAMNRSSSKIMLIADRRDPGEARGAVAVR